MFCNPASPCDGPVIMRQASGRVKGVSSDVRGSALWRTALDRFVERGERLPKPIRDKVIERAQSALKLIDAAEKQAQAEVARAEQEAWPQEKEARRL